MDIKEQEYIDMLTSVLALVDKAGCYIDRFRTDNKDYKDTKIQLDIILDQALDICAEKLGYCNEEKVLKRYVEFSVEDNNKDVLTTCLYVNTHASEKNLISLLTGYARFLEHPSDCRAVNHKIVRVGVGVNSEDTITGGVGIYYPGTSEQLLKEIFKFCEENLNKTYLTTKEEK